LREATGIIPARYGSKRFPGKLLAEINGKPMIQLVYEQAQKAAKLKKILIATDDQRIFHAAQSFGADVCLTSPLHRSGTDRVAEAAEQTETPVIINIQGDEPIFKSEMIDNLVHVLQKEDIPMATLAAKVKDLSLMKDKNIVKVVLDTNGNALYFSRSPLPFQAKDFFWQHIGIYGYQKDFLLKLRHTPASRLEKCERLEQLRVLENGYPIRVITTQSRPLSVDTPQDIIKAKKLIQKGTDD
jgi:3-deoxy-manno-octulosonate cytidylyltransferase (CMP-KDO synthetase)